MRAAPADSEFYPTTADVYEVKTTAVGPSDPDPAALYNGGGQSPAEVNPFLRYASPTDNRLHLPVGTSAYDVIVFYGSTTNPQSMSATLNELLGQYGYLFIAVFLFIEAIGIPIPGVPSSR